MVATRTNPYRALDVHARETQTRLRCRPATAMLGQARLALRRRSQ